MKPSRGPVLSIKDAAAYTSLGVRTMERLAAECSPDLPVVYLTKQRRGFRQADLDAWLEKRTVGRRS